MEGAHLGKRIVLFSLLLAVGVSFCYGDEVDLLLKRLNKAPVISIKSTDGDIIDCIDISKQPALDHPSLKGHSIQRRPSYHPQGLTDKKTLPNGGIKQAWHSNGMCPEETIPIRRTKKEDILRANSVKSFGKKRHKSMVFPAPAKTEKPVVSGHEYAIAYVHGDTYYGTQATINLWDPKVQQSNEFSLSQVWILGGSFDSDLNTIEAGWQVFAGLYGDDETRLFIYWTSDNYHKTGCYNLLCSGFVQTNDAIVLGGTISPVSSYGGTQYAITILVWKDQREGNWWLQIGDSIVGYWPSILFSHLNIRADSVQWGGEIIDQAVNGKHTTTEMGSGHFPKEGYKKASFFNNIYTVNGFNTLTPAQNLSSAVTYPNCYSISVGQESSVANWGSYFYYGGPGGNDPGCP